MRAKTIKTFLATFLSGFGMWVIAGLWHNLILPRINENIHAHHEGIFIMLMAYFILSFLMVFIYTHIKLSGKPIIQGLKIGVIIGILWVFPHGLTMAGVHNTSIIYEIKNAMWHCIEQGIGGIIISLIIKK